MSIFDRYAESTEERRESLARVKEALDFSNSDGAPCSATLLAAYSALALAQLANVERLDREMKERMSDSCLWDYYMKPSLQPAKPQDAPTPQDAPPADLQDAPYEKAEDAHVGTLPDWRTNQVC